MALLHPSYNRAEKPVSGYLPFGSVKCLPKMEAFQAFTLQIYFSELPYSITPVM
jgi:hypothetical protein